MQAKRNQTIFKNFFFCFVKLIEKYCGEYKKFEIKVWRKVVGARLTLLRYKCWNVDTSDKQSFKTPKIYELNQTNCHCKKSQPKPNRNKLTLPVSRNTTTIRWLPRAMQFCLSTLKPNFYFPESAYNYVTHSSLTATEVFYWSASLMVDSWPFMQSSIILYLLKTLEGLGIFHQLVYFNSLSVYKIQECRSYSYRKKDSMYETEALLWNILLKLCSGEYTLT